MSLGGVHPYVILKGQRDLTTTNLCKDPEEETNQQPKFSGEMAPENKSNRWYQEVSRVSRMHVQFVFCRRMPTEGTWVWAWNCSLHSTHCGPFVVVLPEGGTFLEFSSQSGCFVLFCTEVPYKECRPDSLHSAFVSTPVCLLTVPWRDRTLQFHTELSYDRGWEGITWSLSEKYSWFLQYCHY